MSSDYGVLMGNKIVNMTTCPHCDARIRADRLKSHIKKRCPKRPSGPEVSIEAAYVFNSTVQSAFDVIENEIQKYSEKLTPNYYRKGQEKIKTVAVHERALFIQHAPCS